MSRVRIAGWTMLLGTLSAWVGCREVALAPAGSNPTSGSSLAQGPPSTSPFETQVLVFTHAADFRHTSTDDANAWFGALAPSERIAATITDQSAVFTAEALARYDVVAFVNTSGDVLDSAGQEALQDFVRAGGGFVGVHAAADTERDWAWYGELVGGYFAEHPQTASAATLGVVSSPELARQTLLHLPRSFEFTDEWLPFDRKLAGTIQVLLEVGTLSGAAVHVDGGVQEHSPVSWAHEFDGGRAFYTALGHEPETWHDPRFSEHLLEGIRWAAGGGTFTRITLSETLRNPLALALRPDGSVYSIERTGEVRLWDAADGHESVALQLEVDTGYENGLLGIAISPDFARDGYVFLYASQPRDESTNESGPPGRNVLARYTAKADGSLDAQSRTELFAVPSERRCCHEGGQLTFMADGTLLLSTGDNTNPFEAEGAAPLDARPGRDTFNARRTAQNPHDPRGKILRFNPDGSTPKGNLFSDPEFGLPQIYVMGVRNPFRLAPDPQSERLFFGDVGPDANIDTARGPRGLDELNLVTTAGNFGWPLCIGQNQPYTEIDFGTLALGAPFDCSAMQPALLAYDYATASVPALGTGYALDGSLIGRTVVAAAVYRAPTTAKFALPARFDGQLLMSDWARDILASVAVSQAGAVVSVDRVLQGDIFHHPIDAEVGKDGAIYVLEYGSGFWGDNADARLSRIEYGEPQQLSPSARISASKQYGAAPLDVTFSAAGSSATKGQTIVEYAWTVDGKTQTVAGAELQRSFTTPGSHSVSVRAKTNEGLTSPPSTTTVVVGNAPPTVHILQPLQGSRLQLNTAVPLIGQATDPEDGTVACEDLVWNIGLIHNTHSHPFATLQGCETSFTPSAQDHDSTSDVLSFSIELVYTDKGDAQGDAPLTSRQGLQFEVTGG